MYVCMYVCLYVCMYVCHQNYLVGSSRNNIAGAVMSSTPTVCITNTDHDTSTYIHTQHTYMYTHTYRQTPLLSTTHTTDELITDLLVLDFVEGQLINSPPYILLCSCMA